MHDVNLQMFIKRLQFKRTMMEFRMIGVTKEKAAFLAAIKENPRDLVTRKVFADWLDEHDEPEEADLQRRWTLEKQDGIEYLTAFAKEQRVSYDALLFMIREENVGHREDMQDAIYDFVRERDFARHFEAATGDKTKTPEEFEGTYFRCAC